MAKMGRPPVHGPMTNVGVRLDDDLLDDLDRIANKLKISRSDALRSMIQYCVDGIKTGDMEMTSYWP